MPWGGGGGAASLINLVDREFADRTARDTFYNLNQENRNTLSQGESVILVLDNGSSDAVIEIWVGPDAPTTYDNTDWADITSAIPSASVVKTLYESNPNTNPLVDLASQILALLSMDNEGNVNTSASWVFPDGTVYVSENLGIEGAGEAFAVFDRANDRRGYLVGYERGINTRPFYRNLTEENIDVTIQGLTDTNSGTQTFTQNLTLTANRLVTKIYLESTETVTGANLRLLRGSRVVALALEQDFTANTIKEIEIPQGIFCPTGSELTVDIDGVTLKGTGTGQDFEIFLKIDEWRFVQVNLANVDDLPSGPSGGHPLLTIRDTPPIATLTAIAEASVNDNTGLYVVAADQIQATEDTVDTSIMIRALRSGLIDANGDAISTTSRQKRGLRLAGGTLVRVFSGTDLRIVSTPSMTEAGARYPDISAVSPPLQLVGSQILYNTYRNRTFVLTDSSSVVADVFEVRLPSLQNALDLGWVNRNDVFGYRNDRTDSATFNIRTFQVGTEFSSGGSAITVSPGNSLYINPAPSGAVWQVLIFGQSTEVPLESISINTDWYRDGVDATAANNPLRLHNKEVIADGLVKDHVRTAGYENNPISLTFQRKNIQDDIAWIQWWSTWDGNVPPLGTMVEEIKANVPTALSYIESNINANFDFEFDAPDSLLTVQSIGWVSGNTVRYTLHTGFLSPSYALNHPIEIQGATNSVNNGIFLIDSIGTVGDNVYIHITNPAVSSGATDEATTSAFMAVPIYARTVLVADDVRVTNFNLYNDSARTSPRTQFNPDWFNPDATSAASVLQIGYNTDIDQTEPFMALEDDEEVFHGVLGGSRRFMHYFDNRTAYENIRYLPKNFETIYIDTLGVATFFMDIVPGDLPIGESRRYNILSAPQNDDNDVSVGVGRPGVGNFYTSDEGLDYVSILNGTDTTIEIYNNGDTSGWRITQPFEKYAPSASNTNVVTPAEGPLSMSIAEIVSAENQDPSFALFWITSNKIQLKGRFRYRLTMRVKLRFDGAEDTGVSFVNVSLVPTRTRGMTTIDLSRETGNSQAKIDFIRNGNDANDNTKPVYTLTGDLYYYAEPDDEIGWELRFGTFPPGYSLSDLRQIERQYTITAKGGIN